MMQPTFPTSPLAMCQSLHRHRHLIWQLIKREVVSRYRGSILGLAWSFFNPIVMLAVYTFVFSVVFKARWGVEGNESQSDFAIILFVGIIIHGLFAECINRAPSLILGNVNFVKKVVFPLEILPVVALGAALFHALVSLLILIGFYAMINGSIHWTIIYLPLVLLPLMLAILGFSWLLASFGVFLRDVSQPIMVLTTVLLFLSPVFYPVSILPEKFRVFLYINPLTFFIEEARAVLIWGEYPQLLGLAGFLVGCLGCAWIGFWWFQRTRKGFADVM